MSKLEKFGKYRLAYVEVSSHSEAMLLDENGEGICATPFLELDEDEDGYYAIYENIGTEQFEDWQFYGSYKSEAEAIEKFNELIGGKNVAAN